MNHAERVRIVGEASGRLLDAIPAWDLAIAVLDQWRSAGYPTASSTASTGGGGRVIIVPAEDGSPDHVPVTSVEAAALGPVDGAECALDELRRAVRISADRALRLATGAQNGRPAATMPRAPFVTLRIAAAAAIRAHDRAVAGAALDPDDVNRLWGAATDVHGITLRYARLAPRTPAGCAHHSTLGLGWAPRHPKSQLCRFCLEYRDRWPAHVLPPAELVVLHGRGQLVTERLVERHDPANRAAFRRRSTPVRTA